MTKQTGRKIKIYAAAIALPLAVGVVSALLTILVGIILIVSPLIGLIAYTWLLALCIIISGVSTLLLGTKLFRA